MIWENSKGSLVAALVMSKATLLGRANPQLIRLRKKLLTASPRARSARAQRFRACCHPRRHRVLSTLQILAFASTAEKPDGSKQTALLARSPVLAAPRQPFTVADNLACAWSSAPLRLRIRSEQLVLTAYLR